MARRAPATSFLLGAAAAIGVSGAWGLHRSGHLPVETLERLELESLDVRFRVRGAEPVGGEVVLLAFDDRALEEAPELFERRAGQARVVEAAARAGVRVLGLDLVFADAEHLLDPELSAEVDAWLLGEGAAPAPTAPADGALAAVPGDDPLAAARTLLARVQAEAHGDDALEAALAATPGAVLAFHVGARGEDPEAAKLTRGRYGQVAPGPHLPVPGDRVLASLPRFNKAASRLGAMTTFTDASGEVREVPLALALGASVYAPLAVQLVAEHDGVSRAEVAFLGGDGSVHIGERVVPGDRLWLRWRGEPFPTFSVLDLVEGRVPREALEGRIALVGFDHLAQDAVRTPFGVRPGYEVHATAVDNLLRGDPLRRAPPAADTGLALLVGLLAAAGFLSARVGPRQRVGLAAAAVAGAMAAVQVAFAQGLWLAAVAPALSGAAAVSAALIAAYFQEGRQRRFLRQSFAQYLSEDLVEELVADPGRVSLRGERRELTVLFTDIRGFTSISERLDAEALASFLNAYFSPMTRAVLANRGYVDKYIGDAVMALFGAPVAYADHAARACQAVLAMHAALEELGPVIRAHGVELAIGAGVNTGEVVVGNLGSAERFDYTVLGDAVNLASRIEGLTKRYGVFCLVGEETARRAGPAFTFRPVDLVRVKGKAAPAELFELCAGPGRVVSRHEALDRYEAGLRLWRTGDLAGARVEFTAFLASNPGEAVATLYLERIDALGAVPEGWDGVFTHTEK